MTSALVLAALAACTSDRTMDDADPAAAQGFMTAFPDMVVAMDDVRFEGDGAVYRWTLGADGLIAKSLGHFDEADYQRQLNAGAGGS